MKKRKSGCLSWVIAFGLLLFVTLGFDVLGNRIDKLRFPWGYADSGKPVLVGTWVGPLTSGSGKHLGVLLDMELAPLDRGRRRGTLFRTRRNRWLEGRASVCAALGRVQHFTFWGEPDDSKASRFHLSLSTADSVPVDGLSPSHIQGRWDGGDSLMLRASLYWRRGGAAVSSTDDPDTKDTPLTLKHGTDAAFNSLCSQLRGAGV